MLRSLLSIFLSLLMLTLPAFGNAGADQPAGEVQRLVPDASRNAHPLAVKDALQWNDLLSTNAKGRLRAGLMDGSILSLGSNSELRVVQHDASSQQTSLELDYGKLRNQVVKITQPGGKYEVKTPNAVIGVIGTDFYVAYDNNRTTVICYEGQITVTPAAGADVVGSNSPSSGTSNSITLVAGQMVVIGAKEKQGVYETVATPPAVVQASIRDTEVPVQGEPSHQAKSHRTKIAVITAALVVAGLTVALTQINSSQKPCGCR